MQNIIPPNINKYFGAKTSFQHFGLREERVNILYYFLLRFLELEYGAK